MILWQPVWSDDEEHADTKEILSPNNSAVHSLYGGQIKQLLILIKLELPLK